MIFHFPALKYYCIWIKPHVLQTISWLKSAELPRWFKKYVCFGGIKAKSQSSTDSSALILYLCFNFLSDFLLSFSSRFHPVIQGHCSTVFLPPLCYMAGFLQTLTWSFLIRSPPGQNHSAICSFRWCDKACETSGMSGMVGTVSSQV